MLSDIFSNSVRLVLFIIAILIIFLTVVLLINQHEAKPSATYQKFSQQYNDRPTLANEDNLAVFLIGYGVLQHAPNPVKNGEAMLVNIHDNKSVYTGFINSNDGYRIPDKAFNDVWQDKPNCYKVNCNTPEHREALKTWLTDINTLAGFSKKYQQLHAFSNIQMPVKVDQVPHVQYVEVKKAINTGATMLTYLTDYELLALTAHADTLSSTEIISRLDKHHHLLTTMLEKSDNSQLSVSLMSALEHSYTFGLALLTSLPPEEARAPKSWQVPLSPTARAMEKLWVERMMEQSSHFSNKLAWQKERDFQYNLAAKVIKGYTDEQDTLNAFADAILSYQGKSKLSYEEIASQWQTDRRDAQIPQIKNVFEPFFLNDLDKDYDAGLDILARMNDLEGQRRFALLTLDLYADEVKDFKPFIENSEYRNPNTNQPFDWDDTNKILSFTGITQYSTGDFISAKSHFTGGQCELQMQ